jgi:predicted RNase H-like nuclease (RuvC/YqgF family)
MGTDNEGISTTQFPEEVPQTIPDLYLRLKARMDAGFGDMWKEISELRSEMREMETRLDEESRQRYVDLRQRINKLQFNENVADERYELLTREIISSKNHYAN